MEFSLLSAFFVGLMGSGHCLGMCGGISAMLATSLGNNPNKTLLLSYHFGRILSYSILGAIVASVGSLAIKSIGSSLAWLRLLSACIIILLALYIGRWLLWLSYLEKLGGIIWQYVSPLSRKLLPVKSPIQAILLGMLWGYLPCGLIYSMLTWSLASGSLVNGALLMLSFGLGTLPALVIVAFGSERTKLLLNHAMFRQFVAVFMLLYGIYSLTIAYSLLF